MVSARTYLTRRKNSWASTWQSWQTPCSASNTCCTLYWRLVFIWTGRTRLSDENQGSYEQETQCKTWDRKIIWTQETRQSDYMRSKDHVNTRNQTDWSTRSTDHLHKRNKTKWYAWDPLLQINTTCGYKIHYENDCALLGTHILILYNVRLDRNEVSLTWEHLPSTAACSHDNRSESAMDSPASHGSQPIHSGTAVGSWHTVAFLQHQQPGRQRWL